MMHQGSGHQAVNLGQINADCAAPNVYVAFVANTLDQPSMVPSSKRTQIGKHLEERLLEVPGCPALGEDTRVYAANAAAKTSRPSLIGGGKQL
jgi:hypothetical protein